MSMCSLKRGIGGLTTIGEVGKVVEILRRACDLKDCNIHEDGYAVLGVGFTSGFAGQTLVLRRRQRLCRSSIKTFWRLCEIFVIIEGVAS
jgi:hypothetical protein